MSSINETSTLRAKLCSYPARLREQVAKERAAAMHQAQLERVLNDEQLPPWMCWAMLIAAFGIAVGFGLTVWYW